MENLRTFNTPPHADQQIADPPMLLRSAQSAGFLRSNAAFRAVVGFSEAELAEQPFLDWIDPADIAVASLTLAGKQSRCRIAHRTRDGGHLALEMRGVDQDGESMVLARVPVDDMLAEGPEDSADEATVCGTLHTIARIVEDQNPEFKCSILLVADGKFVRGAGPSLPEYYNAAIDGFAIGPAVGSCGTAIYWNVPVIVEDIQADPLWIPFAELAKKAGVAACWSYPFVSKSGTVLGALALYSPEPSAPTQEQLGRLQAAARLTGLAVERGRAEEAFRAQREHELELEDQLRQAAKMEALGVLAGGVAHDFNNVLSTILANAELGRDLLPVDSEVHDLLATIVKASRRAGQFCQQMLAYAGQGSLSRSQIEIGALIPELSNLLRIAVSKKTTLEYALIDQPVYVDGDENQLLQMILNLVTNATEAIGDQEGQIVVSTDLVSYQEKDLMDLDPQGVLTSGEYIRLRVSDNGSGMDTSTVERIFDPFYTTKFTGHGLGLSAVKGIVNRHGGVILIDSVKGSGTTFTVLLPTVVVAHCRTQADESVSVNLEHKRILIADDECDLRDIISRVLEKGGFEVLKAKDGQEAVEVFREYCDSIDCVLLDCSMPRFSGAEAQKAIRAIREDVPIVMMSGYSKQEVIKQFQGAGIAGSLQKPISAGKLLETIGNAITGV